MGLDIRNSENINAWNIRRLVDDESFVPSTQQASIFIILKIIGFIKRPGHKLKMQQKKSFM